MSKRRLFLCIALICTLLTGVIALSAQSDETVEPIDVEQGFGAEKGFWRVFFTAPTGSRDSADYVGGIDTQLIADIENARATLDIAAFEWNNPLITEAVVDAHERGVQVRMVVDDEHVLEDYEDAELFGDPAPFGDIIEADIPFVDDDRGALMHNKFMIIDGSTVWMGSMNYTINGTYRNNNNMLSIRSRRVAEAYQTEFDEMFGDGEEGEFGPTSPENEANDFSVDGTSVQVFFASENDVVSPLIETLLAAEESIHFMTFSFTRDDIGVALIDRAYSGVEVQGVFETRGSQTQFSEMPRGHCAGLDYRQDGNPFTQHHKVFIIDETTVVTGSFNFSDNATQSNDENMVIIEDADLAAQYLAEFERVWDAGEYPEGDDVVCDNARPSTSPWEGAASNFTCPDTSATCGDLTCAQAFACLREGNTRLDGDGDGVPCASVCGF